MDRAKSIEALKTALQTELNGIYFYRMAAKNTVDPKGKEVFLLLADDEVKHFQELQRQLTSLAESGAWLPELTITKAKEVLKGESPILSADFKEKIKEQHFEMSALSIGALLESDSIDFYRKMKNETDDPVAQKLFSTLQRWEQVHLEAITKQIQVLKEEYWADQNFTPLF